jgi:hypothetical protein
MFSFFIGVQEYVNFTDAPYNSNLFDAIYAIFAQSEWKDKYIMGRYTYQHVRSIVLFTNLLKGFPWILVLDLYTVWFCLLSLQWLWSQRFMDLKLNFNLPLKRGWSCTQLKTYLIKIYNFLKRV